MQAIGKGIMPDSPLYFYTPSSLAKEIYFYPLCTGKYHCDKNYIVRRHNYDSYLLLYVIRGKGYAECCGQPRHALKSGDFALLDCYNPHCYGSQGGWDILWIHFDGPLAPKFFSVISASPVLRSRDTDHTVRSMYRLFNVFHEHGKIEEPLFNKYLTDILTSFLASSDSQASSSSSLMEDIRTYISDHPHLDLSLNALAERANLSPYYFLRLFKKETGFTPHEYLILARINTAKFYLKTTTLSIKDIAYSLGFSSESSFCTSFKKIEQCTPNEYRQSS